MGLLPLVFALLCTQAVDIDRLIRDLDAEDPAARGDAEAALLGSWNDDAVRLRLETERDRPAGSVERSARCAALLHRYAFRRGLGAPLLKALGDAHERVLYDGGE